jgi:hypothetical protein
MVMCEEASRSRTRECMTMAHIVSGNPADDRAADATLGEDRNRGCEGGDKRGGKRDFTEHWSSNQHCVLLM